MTRRPARLRSYAGWLVVLGLLAAGCTTAEEPAAPPPEESGSPAAEPFRAPELDGGDATGGAPAFDGRLAVTLGDARRRVIREPCTANAIERLCGSSARFALLPRGEARPLTLVAATTTTAPDGLTWQVRLDVASADAPLPRPAPGLVQVLRGAGGVELEVGDDARVTGRTILLRGLTKSAAWGLVERLRDAAGRR